MCFKITGAERSMLFNPSTDFGNLHGLIVIKVCIPCLCCNFNERESLCHSSLASLGMCGTDVRTHERYMCKVAIRHNAKSWSR